MSRMECLARTLKRAGSGFNVLCFLGVDRGDPVYDGGVSGTSLKEIQMMLARSGLRVRALTESR